MGHSKAETGFFGGEKGGLFGWVEFIGVPSTTLRTGSSTPFGAKNAPNSAQDDNL